MQEKIPVYLLGGLACNEKMYGRIRFPEGYEPVFLPWIGAEKGESLESYSRRMALGIDPGRPGVLFGTSFGGMVAQWIASFCPQVRKLILVSTVCSREELPFFYRFLDRSKGLKFIPFLNNGRVRAFLLSGSWHKRYVKKMEAFFREPSPGYIRWAIGCSIGFDAVKKMTLSFENILRLHGERDAVFPFRRISNSICISGANHLVTYLHPDSINCQIERFLE